MPEKTPVLTPTEARQASGRRLNLRVLLTSMAMLVVIAAVLYAIIYGFPESEIGVPETTAPAAPTEPQPPTTPAPTP